MSEYRLIWPAGRNWNSPDAPAGSWDLPEWWDRVWKTGEALLERKGRRPEERSDLYLVLDERPDVSLKFRGGAEEELEVKVRHQCRDGWELWEKIMFFEWKALEARRLATLLQTELPLDAFTPDSTPAAGAKRLLASAFDSFVMEIHKRRMQANAGELVPALGRRIQPNWLTELVEFKIEPGEGLFRSICFETRTPGPGAPLESPWAMCGGYPQFLMP